MGAALPILDPQKKENKAVADDKHDLEKQCTLFLQHYKVDAITKQNHVGTGMYGSVYKLFVNSKPCALKVIPLTDREKEVQAENEVAFLERLAPTHAVPRLIRSWKCVCKEAPNVRQINIEQKTRYVESHKLKHVQVDEMVGSDSLCMFVLMELYHGSIESLVREHDTLLIMIGHTLLTLARLSCSMCVHGDLRPEHILFRTDPKTKATTYAVIDFGFATILNPEKEQQHISLNWVYHSYHTQHPKFPHFVTLRLDLQRDSSAMRKLKCQVFAMFMNCLQLFAFMRMDAAQWYWNNKGMLYYFDGLALGPYTNWIQEWSKTLPWTIDSIGNVNNAVKIPLVLVLERAGIVPVEL